MSLHHNKEPKQDKAQSLVEFALVLPMLILIIVGIFDLGWAIYANNTVSLAAREGVRKAIITSDADAIRSQVRNTAQGLQLTDGQITISFPGSNGCAGGSREYGCPVRVTVNYTYSPLTPLIGGIFGGAGTFLLTSSATMVVE